VEVAEPEECLRHHVVAKSVEVRFCLEMAQKIDLV
jgi:hypothetical protein